MERLHKHHINFYRRQHEADEDNKWIRRKAGMLALLPLDIHDELHRNVPGVPVMDIYMARRVRGHIRGLQGEFQMNTPAPDVLAAVDNWTFAVEAAMEHPMAYETEKMVGQAAIMAVRMQLPYIRAGISETVPVL